MCILMADSHCCMVETNNGEVIFLRLKKKSMRNRILNYECQQRMEMKSSRGDVGGEVAPGGPFSLLSSGAHNEDKVSI